LISASVALPAAIAALPAGVDAPAALPALMALLADVVHAVICAAVGAVVDVDFFFLL
jgi:hypothetical protein